MHGAQPLFIQNSGPYTVTLTVWYKDFGAQSMALGLGLESVGLVGWVSFRVRTKVGLELGLELE